ncbi:cytochrome c oxidase assembly protein [Paracoccaceae bacterium Fryx2]|nr:cytochrome c oxidase assembly protein [Paracoccaceae bacterium Fryx2]
MTGPRRTATALAGVVVLMVSLSFAAVPFYRWFCQVTGFAGTTSVAETGSDVILDRTVKIRFDGSKVAGFPWEFKPLVPEMDLRIGETGLAFYEAYNPTDRAVAGSASYNVFPYSAGGYFTKIDCFCFEMQVLQPGERVQMPVTFYVDPAMVNDPEGRYVTQITLSYTFFETEIPTDQAALATPSAVVN